ncbi:ankyrin repeat-containing domain protein [Nemania sp. NC0429]|nr:ankyrin repeat-containing domain protein [Nemania sp. NC0429]
MLSLYDLLDSIRWGDLEGVKRCIRFGVDINARLHSGAEPVFIAIWEKEVEILQLLVDAGADIRICDAYGDTPLHMATRVEQLDIAKILLSAGADCNQRAKNGQTPLHSALKNRSKAIASVLTKYSISQNAETDSVDNDGRTPLYYAADAAFPEAMGLLCDAGSNVNGLHPSGRPLTAAARNGDSAAAKFLLGKNADSNLLDQDEQLPIYWAATVGNRELFELLRTKLRAEGPANISGSLMALLATIKACEENRTLVGVNVHARGPDGYTALHLAASIGHSKAVKALLEAESDFNALNCKGWSPLLFASKNGNVTSIRALLSCNRLDLDVKDVENKQTAVSWAAQSGHAEVIELLADAGSDINSLDDRGYTPLMFAAEEGHSDSIRALLKFRPELDLQNSVSKQSAVSLAAAHGYIQVAELLIEAGCDIYSSASQQYLPLKLAAESGNLQLLQTFFTIKSSADTPSKGPFRVKAIAETLRHACESEVREDSGCSKTRDFILGKGQYLTSIDEYGRTVLSWAAESGSEETVKSLLVGGVGSGGSDKNGRTPLSWAAGSGSKEIVQLLLENGAEPDGSDSNGRTPLSWAAESGSFAVVRLLLSRTATFTTQTRKAQQPVDSKSNDKNWTPLWYAALGGHVKATTALLENGADPLVKDKEGRNLMEALATAETPLTSEESSINPIGRRDIRKILEPLFSLLPDGFAGGENLDKLFLTTTLHFPKGSETELRPRQKTVRELLTAPADAARNRDCCLSWLHLPANNMRWVEVLMTKHYEACGDKSNQNRDKILNPKLWADNQNIPRDKTRHYERFMRAGCHVLPLVTSIESKSLPESTRNGKQHITGVFHAPESATEQRDERKQMTGDQTSEPDDLSDGKKNENENSQPKTKEDEELDLSQEGFVLFMPYLHWESQEEVDKVKKILEEKRVLKPDQITSRKLGAEKFHDMNLNPTEKLHWMYLGEDHPLHIRRTLDQYYYPTASNIEDRDKDQTALRYFEDEGLDSEKFNRVLTMVDQLWMWVLPKCGPSPPTIITAFPQRSDRRNLSRLPALVASILVKCGDLPSRTSYRVAEIIVAECSRIYFDPTSNREQMVQFSHVYRTAIGRIMDSDSTRFHNFQETIKLHNNRPGPARPEFRENHTDAGNSGTPRLEREKGENSKQNLNSDEAMRDLLEIGDDIEDLRQIKDIRDELNMMDSLFSTQDRVIHAMKQVIEGGRSQNGSEGAYGKGPNHLHMSLYPPHEVVKRNLEEVERLDRFARKAGEAIEQLLELKQKQADLLLTQAIYNINDATDEQGKILLKQGKIILTFTVVTIVFVSSRSTIQILSFAHCGLSQL